MGNLIAAIAVWPFVLKYLGFKKPTLGGILKHLKPNLILFFPVIAVSIYHLMARLMLGSFSTEEEVGFYTYAERITQIPNTLILALNSVLMPRMANLYAKNDRNTTKSLMDRVMLFCYVYERINGIWISGCSSNFCSLVLW